MVKNSTEREEKGTRWRDSFLLLFCRCIHLAETRRDEAILENGVRLFRYCFTKDEHVQFVGISRRQRRQLNWCHSTLMVRYTMMKRLTQLLASLLFVVTVLTVYLTFDFAITSAVSSRSSSLHRHAMKRSTSSILSSSSMTKVNQTLTDRRLRSVKQVHKRAKPAPFHKSKTGVKLNRPKKKPVPEPRKPLPSTKARQNSHLVARLRAANE